MAYLTATFGSSRARLVASTRRRIPVDRFPLFAVGLSFALALASFAYQTKIGDVASADFTFSQIGSR